MTKITKKRIQQIIREELARTKLFESRKDDERRLQQSMDKIESVAGPVLKLLQDQITIPTFIVKAFTNEDGENVDLDDLETLRGIFPIIVLSKTDSAVDYSEEVVHAIFSNWNSATRSYDGPPHVYLESAAVYYPSMELTGADLNVVLWARRGELHPKLFHLLVELVQAEMIPEDSLPEVNVDIY